MAHMARYAASHKAAQTSRATMNPESVTCRIPNAAGLLMTLYNFEQQACTGTPATWPPTAPPVYINRGVGRVTL